MARDMVLSYPSTLQAAGECWRWWRWVWCWWWRGIWCWVTHQHCEQLGNVDGNDNENDSHLFIFVVAELGSWLFQQFLMSLGHQHQIACSLSFYYFEVDHAVDVKLQIQEISHQGWQPWPLSWDSGFCPRPDEKVDLQKYSLKRDSKFYLVGSSGVCHVMDEEPTLHFPQETNWF